MLAFGLIVAKWLGLAGMALAGILRLPFFEGMPLTSHYMAGMVSTFVMAAAQTMTIYYFIGMTKAVLLASHKYHLEGQYPEEARRIKKRVTSRGYIVLLLATVAMIAGGASLFGQIPLWIHWPLAITTILAGIATGITEFRTFKINAAFFDRVADAIHQHNAA
jgi:hypothetical protein